MLTITGTGLGPDLLVTVDGQPVATLPGATDMQVEVLAPTTVLTTPGTYRLTVVDPARQVGDGFVVASPIGRVVTASGAEPDSSVVTLRRRQYRVKGRGGRHGATEPRRDRSLPACRRM